MCVRSSGGPDRVVLIGGTSERAVFGNNGPPLCSSVKGGAAGGAEAEVFGPHHLHGDVCLQG